MTNSSDSLNASTVATATVDLQGTISYGRHRDTIGAKFPEEWKIECCAWQEAFLDHAKHKDVQGTIRDFMIEQARAGNSLVGRIDELLKERSAPVELRELVQGYIACYCPNLWQHCIRIP